jgi:hypothetical protein
VGVDTGDLATHLADFGVVVELTGGVAETQVERLLLGGAELVDEGSRDPFPSVQVLERLPSVVHLLTGDDAGLDRQLLDRLVHGGLGGLLVGERELEQHAPGLTTATQNSGLPLPEPMRVSAGFFVTGLSGKMLIQTLPPRLMARVMAIRAASIWRAVSQPGSSA